MDDELLGMRAFGGIEWTVVLLFVGVAFLYFLAPVLGYRPDRRGTLAAALYLLVAYAGLSLVLFLVLAMGIPSRQPTPPVTLLLLMSLRPLLVIIAMVLAVVGLQMLRPRAGRPGEEIRPSRLGEDIRASR